MANEPQTDTPIVARAEAIRDTLLGDLEQCADRSTSSVIASAAELASLAQAADACDAIAMRQPAEPTLQLAPAQLDVDKLTHELWNGLQEITGKGTASGGYATIVSDDAVDVLHAALARQGFQIDRPAPAIS